MTPTAIVGWRRWLPLSVVAGAFVAASLPPWGWWPLAFVGVAIWDRLLCGAAPRARFVRSWVVGLAWLGPAMVWMVDLTAPGYPIAVIVFAGYLALAGLAVPGRSTVTWLHWLAVPAAFTLAEAARSTFPFGGVPLATAAMGQAAAPLGQTARVVCALGVTMLVGIGGVALSHAAQRRWRPALIGAAVLCGFVLLAGLAPDGRDTGPLRVAVVQGGGPQGTRAGETDPRDVFERHLEASAAITTPVDLVLWPENVVDVEGPVTETREGEELSELARRLGATLVVGVTEGLDSETFVNASVVVLPDGTLTERYEKVRRVPFGEYVPLRSIIEELAGAESGLPRRDARPGIGPALLDTPAGPMAVAISWEIFFTNRAREGVLDGGEVLLNPTNGSSYWLTQVQTQQLASSRLRAIETGRWVLQAAPTGFSAIVTPDGRLVARTSISEMAVLEHVIATRTGRTIATVLGPLPVVIVAAAFLVCARILARGRSGPI